MQRFTLGLFVAVTVFALASSTASAGPVRQNGRIVFVRARCGQTSCKWRIVTSSARGRDQRVLGWFPDGSFDDHFIVNSSPSGHQLAFMAYQRIWVMNSDGSDRHVVFTPPNDGTGVDDGPSFTPDGHHLVFVRCCPTGFGYSLWMINTNGTHLRDITKEPADNGNGPADTTPQVSPNGRSVAFNRCFANVPCEIALADIRTGRIRDLTSTSLDTQQPNWSPDGSRIVFEYHPSGGTINIAIIDARGRHLRKVTRDPTAFNLDAAYSPDGRWIIFSHYPGAGGSLDLYRMRPDGTQSRPITRTPVALELEPKWMVAP